MNNITIFENPEFGSVRTLEINGDPWFVGKDVASALEYTDVSHAILDHVDEDDRLNSKTQGHNDPEFGQRGCWLINESGVYSLVFGSKLPKAKQFKHWVTSEVLPAIRKTGSYALERKPDSYMIEDPIERAKRWIEEAQERKMLEEKNHALETENEIQKQQLLEYTPKVTYYDTVLGCADAVLITQIAKDYGWSGKRLNGFLRDKEVQYKRNGQWLLYQNYAELGYTKSKTYYVDGTAHISTLWTQKGRLFIYELLKSDGVLPLIEQDN